MRSDSPETRVGRSFQTNLGCCGAAFARPLTRRHESRRSRRADGRPSTRPGAPRQRVDRAGRSGKAGLSERGKTHLRRASSDARTMRSVADRISGRAVARHRGDEGRRFAAPPYRAGIRPATRRCRRAPSAAIPPSAPDGARRSSRAAWPAVRRATSFRSRHRQHAPVRGSPCRRRSRDGP